MTQHEPSTTLPYIHCPHCGMLVIGAVKKDGSTAGEAVLPPNKLTKKDIKILYDLLEGFHSYTCDDEDEKLWESANRVIDKLELQRKRERG